MKQSFKRKTPRALRIAEQIKRDLSELIRTELRDRRIGFVTISDVELTPDYAHAKVYFTVYGSDPVQSAEGLNAAAGRLHGFLFKRLSIHTVPRLAFVHDRSMEKGFDMDILINQAVLSDTTVVEGEHSDENSDNN